MSADDVPAGWYRRVGEPGMLTWWDGAHWTDRRTPIPGGPLDPAAREAGAATPLDDVEGEAGSDAERPGPDTGPIPVVAVDGEPDGGADPVFADPTTVFAPVGPEAWRPEDDLVEGDYEAPPRERRRPRLALLLLPLLFLGLAAAALLATSGSDDGDDGDTPDPDRVSTVGEAVQVAERAGLPIQLSSTVVGSLIDDICDRAGDDDAAAALAVRIGQLPVDAGQVTSLLNALGKGAAVRCPDELAGDSGLLLQTGELAVASLGATSTTTATTPVTAAPSTDTTEVAAPEVTTATTRPRTTTTTRAPATSVAPTTTAPTTTQPACSANYSKCLDPSKDYDCIGQSGDPDWKPSDGGPSVAGPFTVTGQDVYQLDLDGNGIACERAAQT